VGIDFFRGGQRGRGTYNKYRDVEVIEMYKQLKTRTRAKYLLNTVSSEDCYELSMIFLISVANAFNSESEGFLTPSISCNLSKQYTPIEHLSLCFGIK